MAERTATPQPPPPPPWEAVVLFSRHLDPATLAIATCVCRSWRSALSSDELWHPICVALSPSLSTHQPRPPSRRLFSLLCSAAAARRRGPPPPPPPSISLDDLLFAVDVVHGGGEEPVFSVVAHGAALKRSSAFRFELGGGVAAMPPAGMRSLWTVVGRGWKGAAMLMDGRACEVAAGEDDIWFSEVLPPPPVGCCSGGGKMVAEVGLRFAGGGGGGGSEKTVVSVKVGLMNVGEWRYVDLDDGLRYLQHFISPR